MTTQQQAIIRAKLKKARQDRDFAALAYWQDIEWMANCPSMQDWTLAQLEERHRETNIQHSIVNEQIATM